MEDLLAKIASQTVDSKSSGIGVASSFAIGQCTRYIGSVSGKEKSELLRLKTKLETKIKIISPAIDLVEILAARGNTSLETAVTLTKSLRKDIQSLGLKFSRAAESEEKNQPTKKKGQHDKDAAKMVIAEIKDLTLRIEDAVPLISLSVTASGVSLSTTMPQSVSPSRLLQASTMLSIADNIYIHDPFKEQPIGNAFTLTMYQLFQSHAHRSHDDLTWQEVAPKCRVKVLRSVLHYGGDEVENHASSHDVPPSYMRGAEKADEYAYELRIVEDLDDGRVHDEEGEPYDGVSNAGRRLVVPIHQISKIFYTNSGKLLGIDAAAPILLIKRDENAEPPRRLMERIGQYEVDHEFSDEDTADIDGPTAQLNRSLIEYSIADDDPKRWEFPEHFDKEWLAFEIWQEPVDDDEDEDDDGHTSDSSSTMGRRSSVSAPNSIGSLIPGFTNMFRSRDSTSPSPLLSPPTRASPNTNQTAVMYRKPEPALAENNVPNSLSLLECLLRLTGLQNYQQTSHLFVHDELLNLFLSDAYSDEKGRRKERVEARKKIGFDPFGTPFVARRGVDINPNASIMGQASSLQDRLRRGGTPLEEQYSNEESDSHYWSEVNDTSPSRSAQRNALQNQSSRFSFDQASSPNPSISSIRSPGFASTPSRAPGKQSQRSSSGVYKTSPLTSSPPGPYHQQPIKGVSSTLKSEVAGSIQSSIVEDIDIKQRVLGDTSDL